MLLFFAIKIKENVSLLPRKANKNDKQRREAKDYTKKRSNIEKKNNLKVTNNYFSFWVHQYYFGQLYFEEYIVQLVFNRDSDPKHFIKSQNFVDPIVGIEKYVKVS